MKTYIISLVLGLMAAAGWSQQEGEVVVPLSDRGEIGTLEVDIKRGSIQVTGTDRSDVLVKYAVIKFEDEEHGDEEDGQEDEDTEEQDDLAGLKKVTKPNFSLEISENDNEVDIESESWFTAIELIIEVPHDFNLSLENYTGRSIKVENVEGELNLESYTGSIDATHVSGVVNASTYTGNLTITFDQIKADQAMAFSNYTGKIELTLPTDYKADLKMKTVWGDIYSAFDMNVSQSPTTLKKMEGDNFKLSTDDWTKASINGGGPEVMIKNFSGGIYLRKKT
ncbi:MAG: hypothetical protein OEQ53_02745 [Saprospiraceae bacterium]|nr:hypothetical protein [Saprospiraceae bacterium]